MSTTASEIRELLAAEPRRSLPPGVPVLEVAERCRTATLAFLRELEPGSRTPSRALHQWLAAYDALVAQVRGERTQEHARPVRVDRVAESPAVAHAYVLGVVRGMTQPEGDVSFSYAAMHNGWIERCRDETGRPGWAPVARPNMKPSERALSLLAVDYLVRPADWLGALVVCSACDAVEFDPEGRVRGLCREHRESQPKIAV